MKLKEIIFLDISGKFRKLENISNSRHLAGFFNNKLVKEPS